MIVCTYVTGQPYEGLIPGFGKSCQNFKLQFDVSTFPDKGSWQENLRWRPGFIRSMLARYPHDDILYIDVDTQFVNSPDILLLPTFGPDLAAVFTTPTEPKGGVLWLRNTTTSRDFLSYYQKFFLKEQPWFDTDALNAALNSYGVHHLPPTYNWCEREMRSSYPAAKPVILHEKIGSTHGTLE